MPPIPSIDPLIAKFQSLNWNASVIKAQGGWKGKAKQFLTIYTMAAEITLQGVPKDDRIAELQTWLNGEYKFIDGLDAKEQDWKYKAIAIIGARLKTFAEYHARLWRAALALFHGGADPSFIATFARSIDVELTKAWNEGGKALGIEPDEMTDRDMKVLAGIIANENKFILGMASDIQAAAAGGMEEEAFVSQFGNRVNVWSARYPDVVNQALLYFGKKEKLVWKLGKRENHCSTCPRLNGIVAFGDEFSRVGYHPQRPKNELLECQGWECACTLSPTKARRTYNALKKLQAIKGGG
jgi:hypothetical protein